MKKMMKLLTGVAVLGALLAVAGQQFPAQATALRTLVLTTLTATTGTITTLTATTATLTGTTTAATVAVSTKLTTPQPAAETIGAGGTITADACGGVKRVSSATDVTTDTTNSLTAPATAGYCDMLVLNTGSKQIALDANTNFPLPGGAASLRLDPGGSIRVWSDGSKWWHGQWTEY